MKRTDDFETRRAPLAALSDTQLHERFWSLVDQLTAPLLKAGRDNTTPAIERSVLLRMGFSSLEAKAIVDLCLDKNLLPHGAGHVVYKLSKAQGIPLREAGLELAQGKLTDEAIDLFREDKA